VSTWAPAAIAVGRTRERAALGDRALATGTAMGVATLGGAHGGYFPTSWGWCALALAWLAAMALLVRADVAVTRLELATIGAFAGLASWYALSTLWSQSVTQTVLETERALVYPLAVAAALLLCRRASLAGLLAGVWGGITLVCLYALATRLFPDQLGTVDAIVGRRLAEPIGYWNGLGIFAAMGTLLAVGLVARGRTLLARSAAATSLVVLLPTLYFTFSRGAWAALAAGLAVAVAADPRRLQLVGSALPALVLPMVGVLLGAGSHALTHSDALPAGAAHDGRRLAAVLVVLAVAAATVPVLVARVEGRFAVPHATRRRIGASLLVAVLAAAIVLVGEAGGPAALARHARQAFDAPAAPGYSFNTRLFNLSGSGRNVQFRVAWNAFRAQPVLGSGAGTFEQSWLRARPLGDWKIRDVHNGYLEALAELGIVGFGLLCVAFALPLAAARRARAHPLAAAALGAYVAYLVHAGVDWDWELTGVTVPAVLCGVALLLAARRDDPAGTSSLMRRLPALAAVVGVGAFAAVGLLGNVAVHRAEKAVQAKQWTKAEREARAAERWAPWSSEPLEWLGEAQVGAGNLVASQATLRRAVAKDERNWELWFDLALAAPHGSATQLDALAHALRLNPLSPEVHEFAAGTGLQLPRRTS
jgi:O-Antigen ligase